MNRIQELLQKKKNNILNVYCTAGYPALDSTVPVMKALQDNGADMIELGMPYSDPLADGPVIQASSTKALANGMTITKLFDQLRGFRHKVYVPVILMGYMNPVLQYGFETLKLKKIVSSAHIDNRASTRVMEKIGMHFIDKRFNYNSTQAYYEITREQYHSSRRGSVQ